MKSMLKQSLLNLKIHRKLLCSSSFTKDLNKFPEKYVAKEVEKEWYDWWESNGLFGKSEARKNSKTFSLILPPPNVTGHLHLGHALTATIQDTTIRWHRMCGYDTVWIPGSDHAGIATQAVVEKWMKALQEVPKEEIGRDMFLKKVWEWKEAKGDKIFHQLRQIGAALDWSQSKFTMSEEHTKAVNEAFRICIEQGLIYRGLYLVHWSPALKSALSDIEVDHVEIPPGKNWLETPSGKALVGQIYDIKYKVVGENGNQDEAVIVSTTRPETILGDVAVAVHPDDARYADLLNREVMLEHPLRLDTIPLIADSSTVDPNFGTGAVKITPCHDPNDFEVGKRLSLPNIVVIDEKGHMTFPTKHPGSPFQLSEKGKNFLNLPRFVARTKILNYLKDEGLLNGVRDHGMSIPLCSRTGDVIEPLPKPQWFLRMKKASEAALQCAEKQHLKFYPEYHSNLWRHWLQSNRDWCISRQLWWGHQIPMWKVTTKTEKSSADDNVVLTKNFVLDDDGCLWVYGQDEKEAIHQSELIMKCSDVSVTRDEDVLDTWFSSALLPFSNFGWPQNTGEDYLRYYPLSMMETGHDILFFWVARMVIMAHIITETLPFDKVYLHGLITDAHGKKMSKSKGNVIDPLHVINGISREELENELKANKANGIISTKDYPKALTSLKKDFPTGIEACGADALRFGLCCNDVSSAQIKLDLETIKSSRAFCNKIWQAARFALIAMERKPSFQPYPFPLEDHIANEDLTFVDKWILSQCAATVAKANDHLQHLELHLLTRTLRHFLYSCLCDVYVEAVKTVLNDPNDPHFEATLRTLFLVLRTGLQLMHPLMPFITEELYQRLRSAGSCSENGSSSGTEFTSIMTDAFPSANEWEKFLNLKLDEVMEKGVLQAVTTVRSIKNLYGMKRSQLPRVKICHSSTTMTSSLMENVDLIEKLVPCQSVEVMTAYSDVPEAENEDLTTWSLQKLTSGMNIYVQVEGHINASRELQRIESKLKKLSATIDKLKVKGCTKPLSDNENAKLSACLEEMGINQEKIRFLQTLVVEK